MKSLTNWGSISKVCYGSSFLKTPIIDRLAGEEYKDIKISLIMKPLDELERVERCFDRHAYRMTGAVII